MCRRRQDRRLVGGSFLLLYFHFRNQDGGRHGGNRHRAGLRAAVTIENIRRVAGGHDFGERDERRADDVHAAHQLVGPAVWKHFVNYQRQNLKRLGLLAAGESEAAGDVVNQQAEGLVLRLHQGDQLLAQLGVGHRVRAGNDQISLARYRNKTQLAAAVPIRLWNRDEWRARHQESFQHAVIYQLHVFGGNAFVVESVISQQHLAAESCFGGIVLDRNKGRQNLFADFAGESLALVDVLLAETFGAVAENFVEEEIGGSSGKQRRTGVRIHERCFIERFGLLDHHLNAIEDNFFGRRVLGVQPIEIGVAVDVHAIGRFALHVQLQDRK